jgi:hypothetical protein
MASTELAFPIDQSQAPMLKRVWGFLPVMVPPSKSAYKVLIPARARVFFSKVRLESIGQFEDVKIIKL